MKIESVVFGGNLKLLLAEKLKLKMTTDVQTNNIAICRKCRQNIFTLIILFRIRGAANCVIQNLTETPVAVFAKEFPSAPLVKSKISLVKFFICVISETIIFQQQRKLHGKHVKS